MISYLKLLGVPFSFSSSFSQRLFIFNFAGSNFTPLPSPSENAHVPSAEQL